ncbi:unnamed protein product [Rangifer tarandus platyrhynchus]|uniref:Secreted protein n=5 Tax=Rangifer tarandus platyrhynchus TaxID=3082113 RepID=A0ABN8XLK7_RANTA|nr:unnamed protein product [Rangifer tarandus platyrhynchus]CAI9150214.1 unnamed protein product [Rangifer tarandus platyrhynchus]CAI9150322.1 unnamed protein product [Rangifer tarandus platyrhynchus]CAI9150462.1 unnamed protein product [Rangifer tarandus platyrhynchus]CAI9150535.1 unnamed protein product [Rangifer tarandus platyrhynchus]
MAFSTWKALLGPSWFLASQGFACSVIHSVNGQVGGARKKDHGDQDQEGSRPVPWSEHGECWSRRCESLQGSSVRGSRGLRGWTPGFLASCSKGPQNKPAPTSTRQANRTKTEIPPYRGHNTSQSEENEKKTCSPDPGMSSPFPRPEAPPPVPVQ